jgi:hypothetical protein
MARDPGEWYEERRRAAEEIREALAAARRAVVPDLTMIRDLRRLLAQLEYLGD